MTAPGTARPPGRDVTSRIARLGNRCPADVMIWTPQSSASGSWEAMGNGWTVEERSPSRFYALVRARLAGHVPAAEAPGGDATPFRADEFLYRQVADRLAERIRSGEFAGTGRIHE